MVAILTKKLINNHLEMHQLPEPLVQSFMEVSDTFGTQLKLVGRLAYLSIKNNTDSCCYSDLSKYLTLDHGVEQSFFGEFGLGLLRPVKTVYKFEAN